MIRRDIFDQRLQNILREAEGLSAAMGQKLNTGHVLLATLQLESPELADVEISGDFVREKLAEISEAAGVIEQVKTASQNIAREERKIRPELKHFLIAALFDSNSVLFRVVREAGVDIANLKRELYAGTRIRENVQETGPEGEGLGKPKKARLEEFLIDLAKLAREGKINPVIGREQEIARAFTTLARLEKNNPVFVGEAGVGKTAIARGIALKIVEGNVPEHMKSKKIVQVDMAGLVAGTPYRGQFEERLRSLVKRFEREADTILFIDEIHTVVGAGQAIGGIGASDILKPPLAEGRLRCMGATTPGEYRKYIEKDPALERRFQPIYLEPASVEETEQILRGIKKRYEQHHNVKYTDGALREAAVLSNRYMPDRNLPDKAIDLIDEAGSKARLAATGQEASLITEVEIAQTLRALTRIAGVLTTEEEKTRLTQCEKELKKRIIGQPMFCRIMHQVVNGVPDINRPKAVVLLLGGTGVGKTYSVKEFARFLYGKERVTEIDMSEFQEKFTVSRLIGSPPGYVGYEEGGQLTEAVRRDPCTIVLFDEIEKAHPDVHNLFLQIFEEGRLTDGLGRTTRFNETHIFMTSNIRVDLSGQERTVGFRTSTERPIEDIDELIRTTLKKKGFRLELINRIDHFVVFNPLEKADFPKIVNLLLEDMLLIQLREKGIGLQITDRAREFLVDEGYSPEYGARELRRVVRSFVLNPLGPKLREFKKGDIILIDVAEGKKELSFQKRTGQV